MTSADGFSQMLKPAEELARSACRFPGESAQYRSAQRLLAEEIELRRHIERVAAQRRALPPGGEVPEDYRFDRRARRGSRCRRLFGEHDTLVTYNWMFEPRRERPCPMCTSLLGSLDGEMPDILQRVAFAVIARSPIERMVAFKRRAGLAASAALFVGRQQPSTATTPTKRPRPATTPRSTSSRDEAASAPLLRATRWAAGDGRSRTGPARRARRDADLD